jgi:hypothetical protein
MFIGKNFINVAAKGAGRINPQEGGKNRQEQQTKKRSIQPYTTHIHFITLLV